MTIRLVHVFEGMILAIILLLFTHSTMVQASSAGLNLFGWFHPL